MFGFGLLKLWLWLRDFGARGACAQYSPRGSCHELHVLHECRNPMIKAGFWGTSCYTCFEGFRGQVFLNVEASELNYSHSPPE